MREVRFFEDGNGPKEADDGRRLLIGIMDYDEDQRADGGRREAVRVATMADAFEFQTAYAAYYQSFAESADQPAAEGQADRTEPPPRQPLHPLDKTPVAPAAAAVEGGPAGLDEAADRDHADAGQQG